MLKRIFQHKTFQGVLVQGCTALFAFLSIALLTRALSVDDFGSFMIFLTIINMGEALRSGYGQSFYQKVYHRKPKLQKALLSKAIVKSASLALPIGILAVTITFVLFRDINIALLVLCYFIISIPQAIVLWDAFTTLNYSQIFILRVAFYVMFVACVYSLHVFQSVTLVKVMLLWLSITFLTSALLFINLVRRSGGFKSIFHEGSLHKRLGRLFLRYGRFSALSSGLGSMLRSSDPIMISFFLGNAQVAWFTVPQRLMEIPEILTRSIALNFAKNIAAKSDKRNRKMVFSIAKKEVLKGFGIMFLCAIALAVVGNFVLELLAPDFFERSYLVLLCMLPYLLFLIADRVTGVMLDFFGYPQFNTAKVGAMLGVNLLGNFIALYFFQNIYMVAAVSSLTFVTGAIFGWVKLQKIVGESNG